MTQEKEQANPDNYRYLCRDADGQLIVGILPDGTIKWTKNKNRALAFQETMIHSMGMLYHQNVLLNNKLDLIMTKLGVGASPLSIIGG